jgi:hypothetical protein
VQLVLLESENEPAGHVRQEALLVAPIVAEKVPAAHAVQLVLPAAEEKLPAGHAWHAKLEVALAAEEKVPAAHAVQLLAPGCRGHLVVTLSGYE